MPITRNVIILVFLGFVGALAGCQKAAEQKPPAPAAAKVDGTEISVRDVDAALARAATSGAGAVPDRAEVLDRLIDQQLALQQATAKGLDRKPEITQEIEAARREILARAYAKQVAATQPSPSADDIKKFYTDHPELFAQRRVYSLQQLALPATSGVADEIKKWVAAGKSIKDIAATLKERNIPYRANEGVAGAEQLPTDIARRYLDLKDGQTTVIEAPLGLLVVHLVAAQTQPVDEATATPRIAQFLTNERAGEAVAADIKSLRDKAKIEKLGEFAAQPAQAVVPSAPTTAAPTTAAPAAAAPAGQAK